jgi:hypothetical protein
LAGETRQPLFSYAVMIVLGFVPVALVTHFYDVLPNRIVARWDAFGNVTIIGTRPTTILMVAEIAAVIALTAIAVSIWQQKALIALGMRRAYLALNLSQLVVINLVSAMIVSDALGFGLKLKPTVPPAMAVLIFAAGLLCRRMDQAHQNASARAASVALLAAGPMLLVFGAVAANAVVGYYASAVALVAMAAVALPGYK